MDCPPQRFSDYFVFVSIMLSFGMNFDSALVLFLSTWSRPGQNCRYMEAICFPHPCADLPFLWTFCPFFQCLLSSPPFSFFFHSKIIIVKIPYVDVDFTVLEIHEELNVTWYVIFPSQDCCILKESTGASGPVCGGLARGLPLLPHLLIRQTTTWSRVKWIQFQVVNQSSSQICVEKGRRL